MPGFSPGPLEQRSASAMGVGVCDLLPPAAGTAGLPPGRNGGNGAPGPGPAPAQAPASTCRIPLGTHRTSTPVTEHVTDRHCMLPGAMGCTSACQSAWATHRRPGLLQHGGTKTPWPCTTAPVCARGALHIIAIALPAPTRRASWRQRRPFPRRSPPARQRSVWRAPESAQRPCLSAHHAFCCPAPARCGPGCRRVSCPMQRTHVPCWIGSRPAAALLLLHGC